MEDHTDITDKIDQYLNKTLSGNELILFENEIKSNPALQLEIEQQQDIIHYLQEKGNKELKSFLVDLDKKEEHVKPDQVKDIDQTKRSARIYPLRKIMTGIAAGLAIFLASMWVFKSGQIQEPTDLFNEYFTPHPNDLVKIERSETDNSILQEAMTRYNQGDYQSAIEDFNLYIKTDDTSHLDDELNFFKAISELSMGNLNNAKNSLESLRSLKSFEYADQVNWYLSLVYLKTENSELAKHSLNNLINSGQSFKLDEAKALLNQLD